MKHKFRNINLKNLAKRLVLLDSTRTTLKDFAEERGIVLDAVSQGNLGRAADELLYKNDLDIAYDDVGAHLYPEKVLKRALKPIFKALDEAAKAEIRGN
jgi:hypothetical protein